jgi:DNA-binding protein HU-beta
MNKGDLINEVAQNANITKAQAGDAVNAVFSAMSGAMKTGDKIALIGFGTFSVQAKPAREARNPATGKTVQVPAKNAVKFKAGKELLENVN